MSESISTKVTVAQYSAGEIIDQFLALYSCMDFKPELEEIGIGRFQFALRKKALREFRALCVALWGLALQKSFPCDAEAFLREFREVLPSMLAGPKENVQMQRRIDKYLACLDDKKDTDFLPVAVFLCKALKLETEDARRLHLKLSLIMRNLYTMIFTKLV